MEGFVVQVKKHIINLTREIFLMIDIHELDCLGGGLSVLATDMAWELEYNKYSQMFMKNNDFHNNTDCITLVRYPQSYWQAKLNIGNLPPQKAYKYLQRTNDVIDVVETKDSQTEDNCFIIVNKTKRLQTEANIQRFIKALIVQLQNPDNLEAKMRYKK